MTPTLLFIRDYRAFQGGHLKVADYIAHAQASGLFNPALYLTPDSRADHPFPHDIIMPHWQPEQADALFVAGLDWAHVPAGLEERVPILNLIQHPRHALPGDPRHAFLPRRATRICVSEEVGEAIRRTGRANGPVHTIPAGLDLRVMPAARARSVPVLICGLKQPALAQATAHVLRSHAMAPMVLTESLQRADYLACLTQARIAITLPDAIEGFYLPALEAMAAGCAVICPDARGNRAFCRAGDSCLMPDPTPQALAMAALSLMADPAWQHRLARLGQQEAQRFSIDAERAAFLPLLRDLRGAISAVSTRVSDNAR